jgi:hypothetical protein
VSEHTQTAEVTIAPEVAEDEFQRFAEGMDLDVDPTGLSDEDKSSLEDSKRRIIRAMLKGQLVINEKCEPVFTPKSGGKPITFYEPDGAALMATDMKKKGHDMAKTYAAMAAMTKENPTRFSSMPGRDLKVCTAIFALFMAG